MPWGVAAAVGASAAGAAVSSAMSPSTSGGGGGGGANLYVPTGLGTADQSWQQLLQQELAAQNAVAQNAAPGGYGGNYQTQANTAAGQYANLAQLLQQQSQGAYGTQQSLLNSGLNLFNYATDPQNALYNRTLQQVQDQTGATNSMYGLGSSAAGAGVANQALSNFNIDWQNQQLQRQVQGLQAYTGAAQAAGQYGNYGTALAEAAPGYQLQAGTTPFNAGLNIATSPLTSAQTIQQGIIPYLNYGQGATSNAYNAASQNAGALGGLVSQGISSIGSNPQVQSALGNYFGGNSAGGSFSGGDFSGAFNSSPYYSGGGNQYGFTM
jgi:hypothetical protein